MTEETENNEVAPVESGNFPSVMNPTDLAEALGKSQVQETQAGGFSFLKIDFDTGEWACGQDGDDVTDEIIIVNTTTIRHGWILWSGGRPKKILVPFTQPLPQAMAPIQSANGEIDEPSEARGFEAAFADDGEPLAFDTNSYGGRKGIDVLLGKIKAKAAEGGKHLYPKVKLTSEAYPGTGKRTGKTNYNPLFEIVGWCNEDGEEEGVVAEVEDQSAEAAPEPKRRERGAKTEAEEKSAPVKRQRRKRKAAA